ncbi:hypothetical protein PTSG_00408 [Salpingoeca rosetta]|uniref:Activator of Hsp90 ATPase AHSA1-like N-terminal domain-containing protein n=1 Tax=Salpingoeca rosetta (strain ATCC 50818 / BSB-021) TaxID=946362 RepID=F2TWE1_SALR5|nr:uncharacterized protein PTSG_00408 [Salpingoeca rosetta]EGD72387.1 hypothetical protein PTSG_00408 [Salpingoeca rosetta]|eukprot:XP_004998956.1 hypothetical protein PTSG_00408 [Salpingoeca rosetta]
MAKWGEGDPRWIVEERPDVANVNNWHWTEKNATPWSRQFLQQELNGLEVSSDAGTVTFSDVQVEGEATANNRKAKLIFFYELEVSMKWKGKTADGKSVSGKFKVENLSEEYTPDEFEFEVNMSSEETPARRAVKEMVRKAGAEAVRAKLDKWYKELRVEFTKGMILPTKAKQATPSAPTSGVIIHSEKKDASSSAVEKKEKEVQPRGSFEMDEEFLCSPSDLFQCFVDENRVKAYTQADASIEAKMGGSFSLFGGNVTGVIKDLIPNERIVQAWRFKSWPEGMYSEVTMKFVPGDGCTHLKLTHNNIPDSDLERAKEGWKRHQFERIKGMFGFGTSLAGLM